jgi:type I restriction enzyme R subunit
MEMAGIYKHDAALRLPYKDILNALQHEPTLRNTPREEIFLKAKTIKDLGNHAVHSKRVDIFPPESPFFMCLRSQCV